MINARPDPCLINPGRRVSSATLKKLSDVEALVLAYAHNVWLRPEQRIPEDDWYFYIFICGRRWGKTLAIAVFINDQVFTGKSKRIALMAPTDGRVEEVQIRALIEAAPPWFKPVRYLGGLKWPNGVTAVSFTPEKPGRTRSENIDLAWLCEIVDWNPNTRMAAFESITTAASAVGKSELRVICDTTSRGANDVIEKLISMHESNPQMYRLMRGTTFDNILLPKKFIATELRKYPIGSRKYREEIMGEVFTESAGALWKQAWIDINRRLVAPTDPAIVLITVDPAGSARKDADETGIVVSCLDRGGDVHILEDLSGHHSPAQYVDISLDQCVERRASGILFEQNKYGAHTLDLIKSHAATRGLQIRPLDKDKPFPAHTPGVVYVREIRATTSKLERGHGPAAEYQAGRVHHVGHFSDLESELTTFEGGSVSPNRYDAAVWAVIELRNLMRESPAATAEADMAQGALAYQALRAGLAGSGRGQRVGL